MASSAARRRDSINSRCVILNSSFHRKVRIVLHLRPDGRRYPVLRRRSGHSRSDFRVRVSGCEIFGETHRARRRGARHGAAAGQLLNISGWHAGRGQGSRERRDFISKCSISLKESREAHVRLRVCESCRLGPLAEARSLVQEANALVAIIGTILRNTRRNAACRGERILTS